MDRNPPDGVISPPRDAALSLRQARSQLERACQMLLWPSAEALNGCGSLLASVAAEMEASRPGWLMAGRLGAEEAQLTRKALKHARRLLENAADFHSRWQRIRRAMTGGYQADGTPGQVPCTARIFARG